MRRGIPLVRRRASHVYSRWHTAPIRTRLTAAAALAATLVIVCVVSVAYVVVRHELFASVDGQLRRQASYPNLIANHDPFSGSLTLQAPRDTSMVDGDVQIVGVSAAQGASYSSFALPVSARDRQIAGRGGTWLRTDTVNGTPLRIITAQSKQFAGADVAVQVALPLTAVDHQLHKLSLAFLILVLGGLGLAPKK